MRREQITHCGTNCGTEESKQRWIHQSCDSRAAALATAPRVFDPAAVVTNRNARYRSDRGAYDGVVRALGA